MDSYAAVPASRAPLRKKRTWSLGYIMPFQTLVDFAAQHGLFPPGEVPHGSGIAELVRLYLVQKFLEVPEFRQHLHSDLVKIVFGREDPVYGHIFCEWHPVLHIATAVSQDSRTLRPVPADEGYGRLSQLLQSGLDQAEPPQWIPCGKEPRS